MTTPLTAYTAPMPEPWASLLIREERILARRIVLGRDSDRDLWNDLWVYGAGLVPISANSLDRISTTATRVLDICRAAEALAATLESPK